jgi:hypothetical protein
LTSRQQLSGNFRDGLDKMEEWWFVDKAGAKTGPTPVDLLEGLWVAGELDGMTLVWKEGMDDYLPIAECPALRAALQAAGCGEEDEEVTKSAAPSPP